tara:strand:- start:791 stop:1117 length:327 start_codon:yes stop_codon:yes gene_type:complete
MSYLSKEKIESGLSELYELEEFTPKDYAGIKRIECIKIKDIFGYYDYLKISSDLKGIPYSTEYDLMKVIEYYEKALAKAPSEKEVDNFFNNINVVDTSDWKAKDVYPD